MEKLQPGFSLFVVVEGKERWLGVHLKGFTLFGEAWGRNGFIHVGQLGSVFGTVSGFRKLSTLPRCANLG